MGLGRWVELLDENGQPVLDDDFEKVLEYDVSHVDARVLVKLLIPGLNSWFPDLNGIWLGTTGSKPSN
jgi:hypothetical protein